MRGDITMPDPKSKQRWDKENVVIMTVKFMRKTDQDVIDFLQDQNKRNTICKVVREYIANHPEETKGE